MIATAISNHTQLLNYLAEKYNLKSYLEIGVQNPANNFLKIKGVEFKEGVDPETDHKAIFKMTSDEYFDKFKKDSGWDLIFIDGLHHADQVKHDFENSLRCLNDGGFIVIHDTMPEDESTTHVPRDSKMWHGDVYKFAMQLSLYGYQYFTIDMDCGCTVVSKSPILWRRNELEMKLTPIITDWENFVKHKNYLLRVIAPTEIEQYF